MGRREMRVLSRGEITKLLDSASAKWRTLLATGIFSGARLGELLALRWCDIDFDHGLIHVRAQLDRHGNRVEPKTPQAIRSIILMPALAKLLREHRLASPFSHEHDLVFASEVGSPLTATRHGAD